MFVEIDMCMHFVVLSFVCFVFSLEHFFLIHPFLVKLFMSNASMNMRGELGEKEEEGEKIVQKIFIYVKRDGKRCVCVLL